jgi:peptidoglycan/xylan/chitin deacetylase (PgdA/CDA1 family)
MADYVPYRLDDGGKKTNIIELPSQWITDDAPFFLFSVRPPYRNIMPNHDVLRIWQEEFLGIYRQGGLFNLVLHPQFSGRPGRVDMVRDLINHIHKFPNVWIATGAEVVDYWKENSDKFERQ